MFRSHRRPISTRIVLIKWLLCVYHTSFWTPSSTRLEQTLYVVVFDYEALLRCWSTTCHGDWALTNFPTQVDNVCGSCRNVMHVYLLPLCKSCITYLYTSCVRVHVHVHNSYLTVIVVHGMHARMHHNHRQITIHDDLSSSVYTIMIHPSPVADNFPMLCMVARQLPTNKCIPNNLCVLLVFMEHCLQLGCKRGMVKRTPLNF